MFTHRNNPYCVCLQKSCAKILLFPELCKYFSQKILLFYNILIALLAINCFFCQCATRYFYTPLNNNAFPSFIYRATRGRGNTFAGTEGNKDAIHSICHFFYRKMRLLVNPLLQDRFLFVVMRTCLFDLLLLSKNFFLWGPRRF